MLVRGEGEIDNVGQKILLNHNVISCDIDDTTHAMQLTAPSCSFVTNLTFKLDSQRQADFVIE